MGVGGGCVLAAAMAQWSSETVVAEYSDVQVRYSSSLLSLSWVKMASLNSILCFFPLTGPCVPQEAMNYTRLSTYPLADNLVKLKISSADNTAFLASFSVLDFNQSIVKRVILSGFLQLENLS